MKFSERYSQAFQWLLPTPFTIALLLTIISFLFALFSTIPANSTYLNYSVDLLGYWENGLWNIGLIVFAFQMMLMLILGHVLALSPPIDSAIKLIVRQASTNGKAAALIAFFTILVSLFNWGLGLIFGAIIARKVGENASINKISLNYPLMGAAGYCGLMVWHGGISGSSLIKVAEEGHLIDLMNGLQSDSINLSAIGFDQTVFSNMNLYTSLCLIILIPISFYFLGKFSKKSEQLPSFISARHMDEKSHIYGAEKIDNSSYFGKAIGILLLLYITYISLSHPSSSSFGFINPNYINLLLFSLCLFVHKNVNTFIHSVDEAIQGAGGILIQFPLYFGIMGLMKESGMIESLASFFVSISNETTFPLFTLFSAGLVNIFVPSGGGQWAVQGPIIIQAANEIGVSFPKAILSLAYGDQLTNMLQPFWALPLLGITKLKAKSILPYTLIIMLVGLIIFISSILLF